MKALRALIGSTTRAKILLPFAGPKGSGLAMMFETLTSLFAGNPLLGPAFATEPGAGRHRQNSTVAAIDIAAFTDLSRYRAEVDRLIDGVRGRSRPRTPLGRGERIVVDARALGPVAE